MNNNPTITLVIQHKESKTKQLINKLTLFNVVLFTVSMVASLIDIKKNSQEKNKDEE